MIISIPVHPNSPAFAPGSFVSEAVMSIPEYVRTNFNTLLRAAARGDLALVECADAVTGAPRYVKLDDPSFTTPIYANLFDDEGGETFSLIWSRGRRSNGD